MSKSRDYTTAFTVDQTPEQVFAAINDVRGWWSRKLTGQTDQLGAEFTFEHLDLHRTTQRITHFEPGRKVVWRVIESWIGHAKDKAEWLNTDIVFDIIRKGGKTEVRFTHVGLKPTVECYENCSTAWNHFAGESLRQLITTGRGTPITDESN